MNVNKTTVGAKSYEYMLKKPETRDPIELQREMQKDYWENLIQCIEDGLKKTDKDFFVSVITKKEKLMQNVVRNYFLWRHSCPTPDWDQTVFHYKRNECELEYLWTIPDKQTCELMRQNSKKIPTDEHDLLRFINEFYEGKLLKICKKLNKENF